MAFSNSVLFSGLLRVTLDISSPHGFLRILAILFPCYLSIQLFCHILSVPLFYSKILLLPLYPVVGFSSCIFQLDGRIFFLLFRDQKKKTFINIILAWSANLWLIVSNLTELDQISIIFVPSLRGIVLKIALKKFSCLLDWFFSRWCL